MSVLIPIAAAQKFRIAGSLIFLYRRRNRVVGSTIEQTFFRGVISHRVGSFVRAQGRCLAARDFRKRSKNAIFGGSGWWKCIVFARNRRNGSKLIELTPGPTQIDPRGHDATRNSDICSYSAGQVPEKSVFFMSAIRELGFSGGDVCHWSLKGGDS